MLLMLRQNNLIKNRFDKHFMASSRTTINIGNVVSNRIRMKFGR